MSNITFQNSINSISVTTASVDSSVVGDGSAPDSSNAKLTFSTLQTGSLFGFLDIGALTVRHSPAPALGNENVYGSVVAQSTTVRESQAEFMASFHLRSNKGGSSSGSGSADKVALFAGATGEAGTGDLWSLNTVVTLNPNAGDVGAMGYELDCNNQNQHYGDAEGPAGAVSARNYYGLLVTGVGTYRKTAAIAITDVVEGAWNRGIVGITGAISASGSFIQDLCNGHKVSLDILGAPVYGIRQASFSSKNWLNGSTIVGGNGLIDPQARLHVEAGALGGGAGQPIEIFSGGIEAGPAATSRHQLRLTGFRTRNGSDASSSLLRLANYVDGNVASFVDFNPNGSLTFNNLSGSGLILGADLVPTFSRPPAFSDLNAFPAYSNNAAAAAAGYPLGKMYRDFDGNVKIRF